MTWATVAVWDGRVSPCCVLSHSYSYSAADGKTKQVSRWVLGDLTKVSLGRVRLSEDNVRFVSEVRGFHLSSCANCDLHKRSALRERDEAWWGWNPSCGNRLRAQDIVRCP